jgi:rRNA-processing protein FCF1
MEILIDTNFILSCVKQKIDLFNQLKDILPLDEPVIPRVVIDEIEMLSKRKDMNLVERGAAEIALQLIERNNIKILKSYGKADDFIVNYVLKNSVYLATLDRGIKKIVKGKTRLLIIRNRKRVMIA